LTYALTLGPFHAAWRGPQRFIMDIDGESITNIDCHAGMNARNCSDVICRTPLVDIPKIVARVCGTCSSAHALAYAHALESLNRIQVPIHARIIRVIVCELERIAMHLAGAATVCDIVGVTQHSTDLRQLQFAANTLLLEVIGKRSDHVVIVPGGVTIEPSARIQQTLQAGVSSFIKALYRSIDHIIDDHRLLARTVNVGILSGQVANQLMVGGVVGRASGIAHDTRFSHPYDAYGLFEASMVTQDGGDVYARLMVMLLEAHESAKIIDQANRQMKAGPAANPVFESIAGSAVGTAEGPRGLITYAITASPTDLKKCDIKIERQLDRSLIQALSANALLDDIITIIASTDSCSACAEH
jgi:Ni,Fe-hydrogenase III large subunit